MNSQWSRRLGPLMLLGLAALGAFLWRGGFDLLPVERELVWKVPGAFATIRRVDLQLYQGTTLLKREELTTPRGLAVEPSSKLVLARGDYEARVLVWREGSESPEAQTTPVHVGAETVVVVRADPR